MGENRRREDIPWYASHMNGDQGRCLVECMEKRIIADDRMLDTVLAETELTEYAPEILLESIRSLINGRKKITHTINYFTWEI